MDDGRKLTAAKFPTQPGELLGQPSLIMARWRFRNEKGLVRRLPNRSLPLNHPFIIASGAFMSLPRLGRRAVSGPLSRIKNPEASNPSSSPISPNDLEEQILGAVAGIRFGSVSVVVQDGVVVQIEANEKFRPAKPER
jgi:hypothetical protein